MPIDFPNAPKVNDTFTSGGRTWSWDGGKWIAASTSGTAFVPDAPDAQGYARQQGLWVPAQTYGQGYVNKIRNGTFDVWQRGTGAISCPVATSTYTVDGWIGNCLGAAITMQRNPNGRALTQYALAAIGAAGNTNVYLAQRIESAVVAPLVNLVCTFQIWIYNNSGATITPTFSWLAPTAVDNWSGQTIIVNAVSLQSCPSGWTLLAYTFNAGACANGGEVQLNLPALLAGQSLVFAEADLRATPGLAVGLQASPPPPELRPISEESLFCYRYFETSYDNGVAPGTTNSAAGLQFYLTNLPSATYNAAMVATFKAAKRATPTLTLYSPITGAAAKVRNLQGNVDLNANVSNTGTTSFSIYNVAAAAAATTVNLGACWAASAEL